MLLIVEVVKVRGVQERAILTFLFPLPLTLTNYTN